MTEEVLLRIESADGTSLGLSRSGDGPPLLLVHGSTADARRWAPVLPLLAARHTVYALHRRGRWPSADGSSYALAREVEDVRAALAAIPPGPVHLAGHSFGAICALEAARDEPRVLALSLYEPPLREDVSDDDAQVLAEAADAIAQGDPEAALLLFYERILRLSGAAIAGLRAQAIWPDRVRLAHTVVRELETVQHYRAPWAALHELDIPVQLLLGELSLPRFTRATLLLEQSLPRAQVEILAGQAHNAIDGDGANYAARLLRFFSEARATPAVPDSSTGLAALYDRPGFLVRRMHQICNEIFVSSCQGLDLTPNQYSVLFALEHCGVADLATVGRLTYLDRTTTALIVRILGERRLVEKRRSRSDQRKYEIKLTTAGRRHLHEAASLSQDAVDGLMQVYTPEERDTLLALLRKGVARFSRSQ